MATDWMEPRKFLRLPTNAIPSGPMKIAMALEVKKPEIILVKTEAVFKEATFISTLLFM